MQLPLALAAISPLAALAVLAPSTALADTLIVLNKSDATASLIDRTTHRRIATLPTGQSPHEVAVSPDGRTAVVANYGDETPGSTLTVIDLKTRQVERTIDLGRYRKPHGIVFLPDGNRFVATAEDSQALLLGDRRRKRILKAFATNARTSHMVDVSQDGRTAYVASMGSGTVTAIDIRSGKARVVETGKGAEGIDVSPDGQEVWVTNRDVDTVTVLGAKDVRAVAQLKSAAFPIRVKLTANGYALVSNYHSGDVAVFDAKRRKLVRRISFGENAKPVGILLDPDGKRAYVASTNANRVSIIDLTSWKIVKHLATGNTPDGMAISLKH